MKLSEFDFPLPKELIAQEPAARREQSRLMVLDRKAQSWEHRTFSDLPDLLRAGDVLVLNDTKVIPARLVGSRSTGGRVEALLVARASPRVWECWLDSSRRPKPDEIIEFGDGVTGRVIQRNDEGRWRVEFSEPLEPKLDRIGRAPLPPYIKRPDGPTEEDRERYQTVYAREAGSIAAPTAGLHFTPALLESLTARGVDLVKVTLHVGLGTFKPIKTETVEEHRMDKEFFRIPEKAHRALDEAKAAGRRIIAVGTTSVRVLESAARLGTLEGWTDLFIVPPFEFKRVDAMITNFHLPKGTPLVLVSALAGRDLILRAYAEAVKERYRFFSYGDAMLIR